MDSFIFEVDNVDVNNISQQCKAPLTNECV